MQIKRALFKFLLLILSSLFLVGAFACTETGKDSGGFVQPSTIRVTIASDGVYTLSQSKFHIQKGSEVIFTVEYMAGFTFESCDYHDYSVIYESESRYQITLKNVKYSIFVNISSIMTDSCIY